MSEKSKTAKTTTERLAAYLKQNKFMTSVIVVGVVAIIGIAGVVAATNSDNNDQDDTKPATSQADDSKKDAAKDVATAPAASTTAGQTSEVLGRNTTVQSQAPSAQTAAVVTPASVAINPTQSVDPTTPVDPIPTNVAPTITLDAPVDGATVSGVVALSATATDDKAGYTIQYSIDGIDVQSIDWDTTALSDGTSHIVTVTITDSEGLKATDSAIVTVKNQVVDPTKFGRALVSLTFDDGWKSIHANGLPILTKYGLTSTQYINGEPTLKSDPTSPLYDYWTGYMDSKDVKDFATAGHEIAWHTNTHGYDLVNPVDPVTKVAITDPIQIAAIRNSELNPTADFLNLLLTVNVDMTTNYAASFGTQDDEVATAAEANGLTSYRTTYDGYNTKANLDLMNIKVKNVCAVAGVEACNGIKTTAAEVTNWITEAQAQSAWLVIVYHEVADTSVVDSEYSVGIAEFDAQMNAVEQSGVEVVTVQQAIAELKSQL